MAAALASVGVAWGLLRVVGHNNGSTYNEMQLTIKYNHKTINTQIAQNQSYIVAGLEWTVFNERSK